MTLDVGTISPALETARVTELKPPGLRRDIRIDREALLDQGVVGFEHRDPRVQPFVVLRSQILRRLGKMGGRVLAVTSAQPHNGKSFVVANLAAALSRICPVCLVDLDLRRPVVAERLALGRRRGIEDYLLGHGSLSNVISKIDGENLMVLPAGQPLENPSNLLAGERMSALFEELRRLPEEPVCIVDTPPVLEGDDMMIISRHVDAVLLIIEEGRTSRRELQEALRALGPTPLIGTVLNKSVSALKPPGYGYYSSA